MNTQIENVTSENSIARLLVDAFTALADRAAVATKMRALSNIRRSPEISTLASASLEIVVDGQAGAMECLRDGEGGADDALALANRALTASAAIFTALRTIGDAWVADIMDEHAAAIA